MTVRDAQRIAYELLTAEDDGRVCRDIPEEACEEQPRNFIKHVISLAATKTGDGLVDPKLVLSWLLVALGAPAYLVGLLVPLREAGALLPQLFIAGGIRALPRRKWVWSLGSFVQGLAVACIAVAAMFLDGALAGWVIVAFVGIFALARSACSVSYKDVLGKTVSKATRGTATGTATTVAASLVLLFGVLLSLGVLDRSVPTIVVALLVAGGLWIIAAAIFSTLAETPGATEGGGNPIAVAIDQLSLLAEDRQLVAFIATRGLLICSALAPPYLLSLAGKTSAGELGALGPYVVAATLAALSSTYVWGRLSDVSSRKVLIFSATIAAGVLGLASVTAIARPELFSGPLIAPGMLFVLMIAYQGVRLGRSTHIVDMADEKSRAAYTALSNTIVGILLLAGGLFGVLAAFAGEAIVLVIFAGMALGAVFSARTLREVQAEARRA